ncbi:MAG: capsular polysaccharide synthesis protein [Anaerobutyricum sp.]
MNVLKIKAKIKQIGFKNFIRDTFNTMTINKVDFNWRCRVLKKDIADYAMLKKKYGYLVNQTDWTAKSTNLISKKIWICWFQGEENAPDIVRMCIASVRKTFNDYDVVVITDKNIDEFIEVPKYIKDKRRKGIIKPAHFSDLIRLELLIKYGGIWLDSTVLANSKILIESILEGKEELFVYQNFKALDSYVKISNWCIVANKSNPYLITVKNMLMDYWKQRNSACNYYIFHIFFMIVAEFKSEEWEKIPVYSSQPPHILQDELFDEYDEKRFNQIMEMSSIHKLSYKFAEEKFEQKNTIYQHLKKIYLEEKA